MARFGEAGLGRRGSNEDEYDMTPHQTMHFLDSTAERDVPGGPWSVTEGGIDSEAGRFVEAQNRFIGDFHEAAVRAVRGRGEAA